MNKWTFNEVQLLTKLWLSDVVVSKIVEQMPHHNRNAVLGKVHRLRLPPRASPIPSVGLFKKSRKSMPMKEPPSVAIGPGVSLIDLGPNHCRWPIGDPRGETFYFCGADRMSCSPYCSHHENVSYDHKPRRKND